MWVNGHALGRFWNIGPQKTLYVPGPWLKKGMNEVVVFDVEGKAGERLEGLVKAELGQ
jgi:beta-galactosidase